MPLFMKKMSYFDSSIDNDHRSGYKSMHKDTVVLMMLL